jgi:hypothetical protein
MVRTKWTCRWAWLVGALMATGVRAGPPETAPAPPVPPAAAAPVVHAPEPPAKLPGFLNTTNADDGAIVAVAYAPGLRPEGGIVHAQAGSDQGGPKVIDPTKPRIPDAPPAQQPEQDPSFLYEIEPPLGFAGHTSITPETAPNGDFVPVPDRWRLGFPSWDRYQKNHPCIVDYPYEVGNIWNPYKQNVLKGDYPIMGQHTFFILTIANTYLADFKQVPIGTTPFESTSRPREEDFFGRPNLLNNNDYFIVSLELNHGDSAFKPEDWKVHVTGILNYNQLNTEELAVVNPDVRKGVQRERGFLSLEEYFVEAKLADTSPNYDFTSLRIGSQVFNADFKGFLFADTNRAVRLFGTRNANRDQFNVAYFRQAEKDTNSGLNTMNDRGQDIIFLNYYRQDFIWNGFTAQASVTYNHDPDSFKFDRNLGLIRPDPVGTFRPHNIDVVYFGLAGDGHIERFNITSQFYLALGHDSWNNISNGPNDICAGFAAIELSYDRDWARFRTSFMWASGDHNPNNRHANGFDDIFGDPNFAGGRFSYFQHQAIKLFGVNLTNGGSFIPDLRSSKTQGQTNFVNPGLLLANFGVDFDITPKLKMINNVNFLWFESAQVLETFTFDDRIDTHIGCDISTGFEYRPLLSQNAFVTVGFSTLIPGAGFKDLYAKAGSGTVSPQFAGFLEFNLNY